MIRKTRNIDTGKIYIIHKLYYMNSSANNSSNIVGAKFITNSMFLKTYYKAIHYIMYQLK